MNSWIRRWLSRKAEESDLSEELRAHLAIEAQQRIEAGESPEQAASDAARTFGNITKVQEDVRAHGARPEWSDSSKTSASVCVCCGGHRSGRR